MSEQPSELALDDVIQGWVVRLLRVSLVLAVLIAALLQNWETAFMSLLALVLTGLPNFIERRYRLSLPIEYAFVIIAIIYAGFFLGEAGDVYEKFWWWDIVLHASSGLVLSFVGFLILFSLHKQKKLNTSPFIMSLFAFAFGMAAGSIWEIFEFGMDNIFGLNMQKSGLNDTMSDLMVDGIGSLIVARLSYNYVRRGRSGIFGQFVNNFLIHNPRFIKKRKISHG